MVSDTGSLEPSILNTLDREHSYAYEPRVDCDLPNCSYTHRPEWTLLRDSVRVRPIRRCKKWQQYFDKLRKHSLESVKLEEVNCWYMVRSGCEDYKPYHRIATAVLRNYEQVTRYDEDKPWKFNP